MMKQLEGADLKQVELLLPALKEGAAAFMVKPVQEETFIARVVELIGASGQAAGEATGAAPAPPVVQ